MRSSMLAKYRYTAVGSQPSAAPSPRTESAAAPCSRTRLIAASTIRPADSTEPERVRVLRVRLVITRSLSDTAASLSSWLIQPRALLAWQAADTVPSALLTERESTR